MNIAALSGLTCHEQHVSRDQAQQNLDAGKSSLFVAQKRHRATTWVAVWPHSRMFDFKARQGLTGAGRTDVDLGSGSWQQRA